MSTQTTNYGLVKPQLTDIADITKMNPNWDTLDEELYSKQQKPNQVTGSGSITVTIANNTVYEYTGVTTLNMTGNTNEACGFVTFGSSAPSVTVSGFTGSSGDDITSAAAGQVWEFNCFKGRIIWKNWSA